MLLLIFNAFKNKEKIMHSRVLHPTHTGNRFADQLLDVKLKVLCMSQTHIRIIRGLFCHSNALNSKSFISALKGSFLLQEEQEERNP